jgi:DNA-binding MarR family transcriptional regulator
MAVNESRKSEEYISGTMPEIFQLIEILAKKLERMKRMTTYAANLTPPQYVALRALWECDGRPLKELAEVCLCTPATVTGIVDALEVKGLAKRQANPEDRRSLLVVLTPQGRKLEETAPSLNKMFNGCCDNLNEEDARQLARLLKELNLLMEY